MCVCRLRLHVVRALASEKRALVGSGRVIDEWLARLEVRLEGWAFDSLVHWCVS